MIQYPYLVCNPATFLRPVALRPQVSLSLPFPDSSIVINLVATRATNATEDCAHIQVDTWISMRLIIFQINN